MQRSKREEQNKSQKNKDEFREGNNNRHLKFSLFIFLVITITRSNSYTKIVMQKKSYKKVMHITFKYKYINKNKDKICSVYRF